VAVAAECKEAFENVKKGKQNRYIIFYIEDEKSIKVACVGDRNADYDQFLADLVIKFYPALFPGTGKYSFNDL